IEHPTVRTNREAIDAGVDLTVPQHRVICEVEAIDHADPGPIVVTHIELAGGAGCNALDVNDFWHGLNGLQNAMPGVDIVDRDRTAIAGRLVDRIERAQTTRWLCCSSTGIRRKRHKAERHQEASHS